MRKISIPVVTYETIDVDSKGFILLTENNADVVEKLIALDPKYGKSITKSEFLKTLAATPTGKIEDFPQADLEKIIWGIKKDNSIRGVTLKDCGAIAGFIKVPPSGGKGFTDRLCHGDLSLVEDIVSCLPKKEISWASKICKYFESWYKKLPSSAPNCYSIYDNVVKTALPYYLLKHKVISFASFSVLTLSYPKTSYVGYDGYIVALIKELAKEGIKLSKCQIDHVIWYFWKDLI